MSEVSWASGAVELRLALNEVYAQTFTPLWSHTLERLRWLIKPGQTPSVVRVSIQYLKPDGTPTGVDLVKVEWRYWSIDPLAGFSLEDARVDPIRLVAGVNYAFIIQTILGVPPFWCKTKYVPLPSTYPRGKLIKSIDAGATWNTTDLGDLHFGEYGDPPVAPTPYIPPPEKWALGSITQTNYYVNACTRVATTTPCTLRMYVTHTQPAPIKTMKTQRGIEILCLAYHSFKEWRSYNQLEKYDSMFHTFYIGNLKEGEKYWFCFTAQANFLDTDSVGPIFKRTHPGGPPFTTIRRPDAPGDRCSTYLDGNGPPCPDHWQSIDEATPDEEATWLSGFTINNWYGYDLYNIPDLPVNSRPIKQVHLTLRLKRAGGYYYVHLAKYGIKVNGVEWWSPSINNIGTSYSNFHYHLYTNPITDLPWTSAEVTNLQLGLSLRRYRAATWSAISLCTQFYCTIYHACEAYN